MKRFRIAFALAVIAVLPVLPGLAGSPAAHATFPGENGRIAFVRSGSIYIVTRDGSDLTRLTTTNRPAVAPFWSPDGSKLVFELDRPPDACGSIEIINADGTGRRNLTSVLPRFRGVCWQGPSFTPNGRRVLFAFESNIWSLDLHGRDPQHLIGPNRIGKVVPGDRVLKSPRQLPGTRTLAFVVEHFKATGGEHSGLFTMKMNGRHIRKIVPYSMDVNQRIDVSPNGRRIAFTDHKNAPLPNILTVRPDGSGLHHVTHVTDQSVYVYGPSYAPDGRWIVFSYTKGDRYGLRKVRPAGGHRLRVRNTKVGLGGPTWQAR